MPRTADVVIMGGGIIGASIAYHLIQEEQDRRVLVIEQDTTYGRAATPLSMGGIRQQYSVLCNVGLARYGAEFYSHFDTRLAGAWGVPQAHFHQRGYLVLIHARNQSALQRRYALQRQLGVEVEMLSPAGVHELVPSLCTEEIVGGIYGCRDGYLNPRDALQGFVECSRELGAIWVQDEVTGFAPHTDQGQRCIPDIVAQLSPPPSSSPLAPGRNVL